jgi:protease-4
MRRILTGIFASIGFFFVVLIVAGVMLASMGRKEKPVQLPEKIVLMLDLTDGLKETTAPVGIVNTLDPTTRQLSLQQIIQTLEQARLDSRVQGISVSVQDGEFGLASVQELRSAVQRFRRSGKFAYFYADTLGDRPAMAEYWLASAFDQIWLQPMGGLAITGFAAEIPFGRALLDKIGVTPEIQHVGKYKSFPESIMLKEASTENREMTEDMLHVLSSQFAKDITQTRKISQADLQKLMQESPITSADALKAKLIDTIGYHDEFDAYLEQKTKGGEPVAMSFYHENGPRPVPGEKMAIIHVVGALVNQSGGPNVMPDSVAAEDVVDAIQDATDRKHVKAIIVRVDSPGGTPLAADMIRRAIELAKIRKPVVISMGNSAASGGYWMSVDASKIVAQPATMTGSIGVFGGKFSAAGLWDKIGVNWQKIPTEGQQDLWSINRPYSEASRAKVQATMQHTYDMFVTRVAEGRHMKEDKVRDLAQGRVWMGEQAFENGLVDGLGGVDVAVTVARDLAKIPASRTINLEQFPKDLSVFEQVMQMLTQGSPLDMLGVRMQEIMTRSMQIMLQTSVPKVSS